ncbi:DNA polymerase III subunit gamma/tau [Bifidobacterium sp. ESL0775]|uniref:DNA polymerase III subunit gamma/tau n=1 Tax=Bifidobacterium sp. ESL0775 TaxID=2983230 RepID=UPI0023F71856|nr:DNA polymerase III subunit gamma/tau [Bifidobacterium sp. ESL0775]WEV69681.1 DNA polymerase III subunit gamma/tau [Bifidobacterium sp. ESL0775]
MALALYRRYRPDTFDGIIGQDQVTIPLSRALDEGKLTHAYLFSGPRGCGKTSSARILARCINCAKGPTSHPCGECESCKDLATGGPGSIDVVEIDAASHNGVDDARELRERAAFAPARDRYKIFILDEAHMVTQQGFNALLKIVEEPPEHVMFIFATTEPEKVISTIRSRTHHYPFRLVPPEVMGPYLEEVCEKEHIELEPGVLKLTMRAGGGSVRDTLSVLDQLMAGASDNEVSYDSAVALLGFTPDELIGEAIDAVIDKDGEKLYGVVEKVVVGGFEPRRFVEDLLARVRDLLVLTLGGEKAESALNDDSSAEDMGDLHRQSSALGLSTLTGMAETINDTLGNMTGAISPRMRLELLAAKLLAGRENGFAPAPATGAPVVSGGTSMPAGGNGMRQGNGGAQRRGGFIGSSRNAANRQQGSRQSTGQTAPASNGFTPNGSAPVPQSAGNASMQAPGAQPPAAAQTPGVDGSPAASQGNTNDASGRNPRSSAENAANAVNGSDQQGDRQASPVQVNVDPNATVEEKWDVVLGVLPENVREYVEHAKVPKVALATNPAGKSRLSMTFDCALSQHAFALAIASDAEHNGQKAANVVLDGVRSVFGPQTMIAPTSVAANGEKVISTKRMKPEDLAKVKHDIAMAKVSSAGGLGTAAGQGGHAASQPKEQKKADADASGESDDSSHRDGGAALGQGGDGTGFAGSQTNEVPGQAREVHQPVGASGNQASVRGDDAAKGFGSNPNLTAAATQDFRGGTDDPMADDYDPWMHPLPTPGSGNGQESTAVVSQATPTSQRTGAGVSSHVVPAGQPVNRAPEHHKKHVAVPDVSDGIDPWATASAESGTDQPASVQAMGQPAPTATDEPAPASTTNDPAAVTMNGPAPTSVNEPQTAPAAPQDKPAADPDDRGDVAARFESAETDDDAGQPQVAAEDDDYSLNDQSLGEATSVDMDELSKLFDVKKVETFAADDPKNPKNIKPVNRHPEDERRVEHGFGV